MKSKPYLLFLVFIACAIVFWNCSGKSTVLTFYNKANISIDSIIFMLNNYKYKMENIGSKSIVSRKIYIDTIRLNGHDVIIIAKIYKKDSLFRGGMHYNDLYGGVEKEYKLTLNKDLTTSLTVAP